MNNKDTCYSLEKVTEFLTKVAVMKTNYIYYGYEPDARLYVETKTNSENELNFSDALNGKCNQFSPAEKGLLKQTAKSNKFVNGSANVQKTLFDFDGMSAQKIEKVDFTVFVSS